MSNIFYVYGYFEVNATNPFYIGKGYGDRMWEHFRVHQLIKWDLFHIRLREMVMANIPAIPKVIQGHLAEQQAFELEISLIAQYGRVDLGTGCLLNQTDGGQGPSGWIPSKETRDRIGRANYGRIQSPEERLRRCEAMAGLKKSKLHKQRIREAHAERTAQPVESFDLKTGETIKLYSSVQEASRDGFDGSSIRQILSGTGQRKQTGGLGWRRPNPLPREPVNQENFPATYKPFEEM